MRELSPAQRRQEVAWAFADTTRNILGPTEDYEALSDESVRLLERLATVVLSVMDALTYRDTRAAYAADGRGAYCPAADPDLSVDDAEFIADMAEGILRSALRRRSAVRQAREDPPDGRKPRAVA